MWWKVLILVALVVVVVILPQVISRWLDKDDKDEEDCHCQNTRSSW